MPGSGALRSYAENVDVMILEGSGPGWSLLPNVPQEPKSSP